MSVAMNLGDGIAHDDHAIVVLHALAYHSRDAYAGGDARDHARVHAEGVEGRVGKAAEPLLMTK